MRFKGRSLYNSLQIEEKEDASLDVEPWQVRDYREMSTELLLKRLGELEISLTEGHFLLYAENCETPEELIDCLWWAEEETPKQEEAFLLVFELWRRLLPTKRTVSIFADDLDQLIMRYDREEAFEEDVIELLFELEEILRQGRSQGLDPQQVFSMVAEYAAQDMEQFLYDYILEVLDGEDGLLASTLIEMFEEYVPEKKWFDLLQVYLLVSFDEDKALHLFCQILEEEKERSRSDIPFLEEVFIFLLCSEDMTLLAQGLGILIRCLFLEQDRQDFLEAIREDCPSLGLEALLPSLEKIIERAYPSLRPLTEEDWQELESFFLDHLLLL